MAPQPEDVAPRVDAGPDPVDAGPPIADAGPQPMDSAPLPSLVTTAVSFQASDGKTLAANLHVDAATAAGAPGVLLVHQYKQTKAQWDPVVQDLTTLGYRVLAMDLRGHGDSDPQNGALIDLLNDPNQAPLDVQAALAWLKADGQADPARIAIIGTSIGANLAAAANALAWEGVKLSASLSPRDTAVANLAGNPFTLAFGGFYCIAGANDGGGAQATTCQTFTTDATDPKALVILDGTAAHGKAIVEQFPEEWAKIVAWLSEHL